MLSFEYYIRIIRFEKIVVELLRNSFSTEVDTQETEEILNQTALTRKPMKNIFYEIASISWRLFRRIMKLTKKPFRPFKII